MFLTNHTVLLTDIYTRYTGSRITHRDITSCDAGSDTMMIGYRLRELRNAKNLSQGEIEKRTGLLRCYISRVENGHTVPAVETLEKFARALEVPMYQLVYNGEEPPVAPRLPSKDETKWGSTGREARYLLKLCRLLARIGPEDRSLLMHIAQQVADRKTQA